MEKEIEATSELRYLEEEGAGAGGDNQDFRSRVKLREELRGEEDQLRKGEAQLERLMRRREKLTVSLEAEKTLFRKQKRSRDNERSREAQLERELAATKEDLRKL